MSKRVLITGASRGIGLGLAERFMRGGYEVVAGARKPSPALTRLGCRVVPLEVTDEGSVSAAARELRSLDVLINNAGVSLDRGRAFEDLPLDAVLDTILTNSVAPMRVTRAFLPLLKKSERPVVVQLTSALGSISGAGGGYYGYRMSKAALNMFHKAFSADYPGIISLAVHPGWVKTDMGGEEAPVEVPQSADGIFALVEKARQRDSGGFFDYQGKTLPW